MKKYCPEGVLFKTKANLSATNSFENIYESYKNGYILEERAIMCDKRHNLYLKLGDIDGIIEKNECAMGIEDGTTRDIAIISRVNKPVAFKIMGFKENENGKKIAVLSRRILQEECIKNYISKLKPGDIIDAKVTHNESFGSFCDIGCGISALLPIDSISVSRIPHPDVRFKTGDMIKAIVKSIDEQGRVTLSHKELLGTWDENVSNFSSGETVGGIVRSIEKYGIFIELAPNLAGLAEYSPYVSEGDFAGVYIKSINREKMKIKLAIVDSFEANYNNFEEKYYFKGDRMDYWRYSPDNSQKIIESTF